MKCAARALVSLALGGCAGAGAMGCSAASEGTSTKGEVSTHVVPDPESEDVWSPNSEEALAYMRVLAPRLVGRALGIAEEMQLQEQGYGAVEPLLQAWTKEQGFIEITRTMLELELETGGARGGIDFDLPGNIVEHVLRHDRPWAEILTSQTCYDADDNAIPCDTGAPFAAGVLTTRAYLFAHAYRFNFMRGRKMLEVFACRDYPLADELQPRADLGHLIQLFHTPNQEQQVTESWEWTCNKGFSCYECHGQLATHTQLFVKFDTFGTWQESATGQQKSDAEIGYSTNDLYTSQLVNPTEAGSEASQLFGEPVENLSDAARVLGSHRVFYECSIQSLLDYVMDIQRIGLLDQHGEVTQGLKVDPALLEYIQRAMPPTPSLSRIAVETFSHPRVIATMVKSLTSE